jgi:hypothetical protein
MSARQQRKVLFGFAIALGFGSCTTAAAVGEKLRPRAAFDLECPQNQLTVTLIEGGGGAGMSTYGVVGCGKRARYETACSSAGGNCLIDMVGAGTSDRKNAVMAGSQQRSK